MVIQPIYLKFEIQTDDSHFKRTESIIQVLILVDFISRYMLINTIKSPLYSINSTKFDWNTARMMIIQLLIVLDKNP